MSNLERFLKVYDEIQKFALSFLEKKYQMDVHRKQYMKDMLDTTCLCGKYNRGVCVVNVAEEMAKDQGVDDATLARILHDACICGWMIELLQAHFLVEDDIMDGSKVRRGKPCWYLHPGVTQQVAINDGLILLALANAIASNFLAGRPFLAEVLRIFHEVDLTTTIGQLYDVTSMVDSSKLDAHTAHPQTTDYVEYTAFNYGRIVKYKTAYYTYWLPLMFGLLVSESAEKVDAARVENLAMVIGEYFQVQDDVMDCFTPPEKLGKVGTDIQDAKCSWLAVKFLEVASPDQIQVFKKNYGQDEEKKIAIVKRLFEETKLLKHFQTYEEGIALEVHRLITDLTKQSAAFGRSVQMLWDRTYKRQK
ncbi:unnamed protein product [Phytomonas sp. Hart1]|nr:unnamed protein product [Phytomonas sp. Hart1]|eukprot:CCW66323.1 unnamed protein product [Phytomonas sp. isolate Hart1]